MLDLTISVVSHGHGPMVADLLRDLDQDPSLRGATVLLTLNIPDIGFTPEVYSAIHLVVFKNAHPKGFGANHNNAFAHCSTRWFLVLNPDVRLTEPVTARLVAAAAEIEQVGVIAPRVTAHNGTAQDSVRRLVTPWSIVSRVLLRRRPALVPPPSWRKGEPFFWLAGMFLLVDADAFRSIGGFDERIFLYYEDYDLCARLFLSGYALAFASDIAIVHEAQRSSHRSVRYLAWHLSSLFRLWLSPPFWRLLAASSLRKPERY